VTTCGRFVKLRSKLLIVRTVQQSNLILIAIEMLGLFWSGGGTSGEEILDRPLSNFDVIGIPMSKLVAGDEDEDEDDDDETCYDDDENKSDISFHFKSRSSYPSLTSLMVLSHSPLIAGAWSSNLFGCFSNIVPSCVGGSLTSCAVTIRTSQ